LLCRNIKRTDDLQKELPDTKSILGGEIELLKRKVQELETQLDQQKKRNTVIDADEVHKEGNLESLEILAEVARQTHSSSPKVVARQTHSSSPKVVEVSKLKKPIHFSIRSRRQYLAKKAVESSKVSSGDEILMTDAGDTLQENEPTSDVPAEKTSADASQSEDTFFVVGKEYVVSSSKATSADPMPKEVPVDESADLHVDCPDGSSAKDTTNQHSVPPEATSTQTDKGKSVMVDQDISSRK
jgi:hypothetical protein